MSPHKKDGRKVNPTSYNTPFLTKPHTCNFSTSKSVRENTALKGALAFSKNDSRQKKILRGFSVDSSEPKEHNPRHAFSPVE